MTEAKRRRIEAPTPTLFYDHLPPDVIVGHIFPHFKTHNLRGGSCRFFGRFRRDPLRYPWFIYRRVTLTTSELEAAVHAFVGAPFSAEYPVVIPCLRHKQIQHFGMHDNLCKYPRETNIVLLFQLAAMKRRKRLGTKVAQLIEEFGAVLFKGEMRMLESVDDFMWRFLILSKTLTNIPNIRTVVCSGEVYPSLINIEEIFPPAPYESIKRFLNISVAVSDIDPLFVRAEVTFPNMHTMHITDWGVNQTVGKGFLSFVRNRQVRSLVLSAEMRADSLGKYWPGRVMTRLELTADSESRLEAPLISSTLEVLVIQNFDVPRDYTTPQKVTFENCQFMAEVVNLHERTIEAAFLRGCRFSDTGVTVQAINLKELHFTMVRREEVNFLTPKLEVCLLGLADEQRVTINSDNMLHELSVSSTLSRRREGSVTVPTGVKTLHLLNAMPQLIGMISTVTTLKLGCVEKMTALAPPTFTNLKKVIVDGHNCLVASFLLRNANRAEEYFLTNTPLAYNVNWGIFNEAKKVSVSYVANWRHENLKQRRVVVPDSVETLQLAGNLPHVEYYGPNVRTLILGRMERNYQTPVSHALRNLSITTVCGYKMSRFPKLEWLITNDDVSTHVIDVQFDHVLSGAFIRHSSEHTVETDMLYLYMPYDIYGEVYLPPNVTITQSGTLYVPRGAAEKVLLAMRKARRQDVTVVEMPIDSWELINPFRD